MKINNTYFIYKTIKQKEIEEILINLTQRYKSHQPISTKDLDISLHTTTHLDRAVRTMCAFANTNGGLIIFGMNNLGSIRKEVYNEEEFFINLNKELDKVKPKLSYRIYKTTFRVYKPILIFVDKLDYMDLPAQVETQPLNKSAVRQNGFNTVINGSYLRALKNAKSYGELNESSPKHGFRVSQTDKELSDEFYKSYIKKHKDIKITKTALKKSLNYNLYWSCLAYIMSLALYPQLYYPYFNIEIYNDKTGEIKIIDGSIYRMLYSSIIHIKKEYGYKIIQSRKGIYRTKFLFHEGILKELLYNSLIHRDYSQYSSQIPIRITLYDDSIEITNPGYSFISGNILKTKQKIPTNKNMKVINDLLVSKLQPKHGFSYVLKACQLLKIKFPIIKNIDGMFYVKIFKYRNDYIYKEPYTIENIIRYCIEPKSKLELYQHFFSTAKTDFQYFYNKYIKRLVEYNFLIFTIESKPHSKNQKLKSSKEVLELLE